MRKLIGHIYEEDGKEIIERFPRKRSLWIESEDLSSRSIYYRKKIKCPSCEHYYFIPQIMEISKQKSHIYCGYCGSKNIVEEKECEVSF